MVVPALLTLLLLLQPGQTPTSPAGELEVALPELRKTCELNPKDGNACYFLARTLYALDRWEDARDPFDKALRAASKPMLARIHRAIALNSTALGNTEEAERHFRKAVELNPGAEQLPEDPRIDFGAFLFRQGRLAEALPLLKQAVQAVPESARAHTELGRVLLHLGKIDAAAGSLEEAVKLNPRASSTRLLLGRAYLQLGRTEEGQKQLQLARDGLTSEGSSTVR